MLRCNLNSGGLTMFLRGDGHSCTPSIQMAGDSDYLEEWMRDGTSLTLDVSRLTASVGLLGSPFFKLIYNYHHQLLVSIPFVSTQTQGLLYLASYFKQTSSVYTNQQKPPSY